MSISLDWNKLLCKKRPQKDGKGKEDECRESSLVRNEFGQDFSRVVFSPPFRRLSKKTQVHPFSSIDFVHNRLTHSVEVASLGQTFGLSLAKYLHDIGEELPEGTSDVDFVNVISAACLAHDIGNPPFGHAGEDAIKAWAGNVGENEIAAVNLIDWREYDGNAQAFRMVSNPVPRNSAYFRLTYASCGSLVKYPWVIGSGPKPNKAGCFIFDEERFQDVMSELGLYDALHNQYFRHPFSYLMEAADDICYRVMDVEDAVTMHIVSEDRMKKLLADITGEGTSHSVQHLRGNAINKLCESAFGAFTANYGKIMKGEFNHTLVACSEFTLKDKLEEFDSEYKKIFDNVKKSGMDGYLVSCLSSLNESNTD